MLSYHNDPAVKAKYLARVQAHAATDRPEVGEFISFCLANGLLLADPVSGILINGTMNREVTTVSARGYIVASVRAMGTRMQVKAHQVIWISENGRIPSGAVLDHINRVKTDNRLCNLRLADAVTNSRNRRSYKGSGNPAAKLSLTDASSVRQLHAELRSYARVAKEFGVSRSLVAQIVRGELWSK